MDKISRKCLALLCEVSSPWYHKTLFFFIARYGKILLMAHQQPASKKFRTQQSKPISQNLLRAFPNNMTRWLANEALNYPAVNVNALLSHVRYWLIVLFLF